MNDCRRSDHRVLNQGVGFTVFETRPLPEGRGVHGQHTIAGDDSIEPVLKRLGLARIVLSRDLDPCLDLSDRDGGEEQPVRGYLRDPAQYRAMRPGAPQLRYDVGIEEIRKTYSKTGVAR